MNLNSLFESRFPSLLSSSLNLDVGTKPTGNSSSGQTLTTWGEWIVDTAGLDKTKWKVNGTGIEPIYQFDATTPTSSQSCGLVITINPAPAQGNTPPNITFDPDQINGNNANNSLCKHKAGVDSNRRREGYLDFKQDSNP